VRLKRPVICLSGVLPAADAPVRKVCVLQLQRAPPLVQNEVPLRSVKHRQRKSSRTPGKLRQGDSASSCQLPMVNRPNMQRRACRSVKFHYISATHLRRRPARRLVGALAAVRESAFVGSLPSARLAQLAVAVPGYAGQCLFARPPHLELVLNHLR
jgi:hypothetical protein